MSKYFEKLTNFEEKKSEKGRQRNVLYLFLLSAYFNNQFNKSPAKNRIFTVEPK